MPVKRKKFFEVEIPLLNKKIELLAELVEELEGKHVKLDLTRILKGKCIEINFKIFLKDGKPIASPQKLTLMPYFLRRAIRKGTNYVEDSFSVECKDAKMRIKPFLITRKKVSRSVRKALRNKTKEELINYVKNKKFEEIFDDIIKNKLQKPLSLNLKKIYPLALCEIRILKLEKSGKTTTEPKKEEK